MRYIVCFPLSLLRRGSRRRHPIVVEHWREPLLAHLRAPAFAPRVVLDLVALDLADAEIMALRVAEIEAAHRGAGPHGEALGEPYADARFAVEQTKQGRLLAMVGLRRIAGRRADTAIFFPDHLGGGERLVARVAPELLAHARVHALGQRLGEPVGERLDHD